MEEQSPLLGENEHLAASFEALRDFARAREAIYHDWMAKQYDKHVRMKRYKLQDVVYVYRPQNVRPGISPKLTNVYDGPYVVKKLLRGNLIRVEHLHSTKTLVVHKDFLCLFRASD